MVLDYTIVQDKPLDAPQSPVWGSAKGGMLKALCNPQNCWLVYTLRCLFTHYGLVCPLGASYLQVAYGVSDIAASNIISLIFMGSVIGCPLVGGLSDTQGRRNP